jgi:hypothetical protein
MASHRAGACRAYQGLNARWQASRRGPAAEWNRRHEIFWLEGDHRAVVDTDGIHGGCGRAVGELTAMANLLDAIAHIEKGELSAARAICLEALRNRESPEVHGLLAEIGRRGGDFESMARHAEKAVELAPRVAEYRYFHGLALLETGAVDEAIESLDRAIDLRLSHKPAQAALGTALSRRARFEARYLVSVITPTIGSDKLARAIESVQAQTYSRLEHLIVVDGAEGETPARAALPSNPRHPCHLVALPFNTGADGFKGHRIYGAAVYLVSGRYVAFLDEDNWFEPRHIESLMELVESRGLEWAHALRNIVDREGRLVTQDDCESLGKWPMWLHPTAHLVDMNCYLLRRDTAVEFSPRFHRRSRDVKSPDALLCQYLLKESPHFDTNGDYTVNYTVGSGPNSVTADFFLRGNAAMRQQYPDGFPWRRMRRS